MTVVPFAIWGAVLLIPLVIYLVTARRAKRLRSRSTPAGSSPGPGDLDHYQLALLTGGRRRVGQVALAKLFLAGAVRIRRRRRWPRRAAQLEVTTPPASPGSVPQVHPAESAAIEHLATEAITAPGGVVRAVARDSSWAEPELDRMRTAGLVVPAKRLRRLEHWRSFASGLLAFLVVPLAGAAVFSTIFVGTTLVGSGVPGAMFPLFFLLPLLLVLTVRWFGVAAVVVLVAVLAVVYLAVPDAPTEMSVVGVGLCVAWLAVYGVGLATRRHLGARAPAGDDVVADVRHQVSRPDREWSPLFLVALFGLEQLPQRLPGGDHDGGGDDAPHRFDELADFAAGCGPAGDVLAGDHGDGGPGGSFGSDGGSGSFGGVGGFGDAVGGGAGIGGGGDGGGGGGGDGGGSGGGGGGGGGGAHPPPPHPPPPNNQR
ncbi:TIGR04222 domain-containing membrane protein, partial [Phytoactinopolyspora limicola]|uniref:TIGR04222 domain-containing membrane protein n=1 Tax=Phytoactinopolyspora limicola TaxID=2715536 RepID=UPI0024840C37